jgi:hypothetical protein
MASRFIQPDDDGELSFQGILLATALLAKKLQKRRMGLTVSKFPILHYDEEATYIDELTLFFLAVNKHLFPEPRNGRRWSTESIIRAWKRINPSDIVVVAAIGTLRDPSFDADMNGISYAIEEELVDLGIDVERSLPVRMAMPFEAIIYVDEAEEIAVDIINTRDGYEALRDESGRDQRRFRR